MAPGVPKPGPAVLGPRAGLDEWLEQAKLCRYLPESAMKQLCEMVKECLMEGEHLSFVLLSCFSLTNLQSPISNPSALPSRSVAISMVNFMTSSSFSVLLVACQARRTFKLLLQLLVLMISNPQAHSLEVAMEAAQKKMSQEAARVPQEAAVHQTLVPILSTM